MAASLAALALLIVTSPHGLRYDEKFHLVAARLADQIGLLNALQSPDNRSAAGPLFLALQLLAAPFTQLQVPAARFLNWVLLLVTIALTYLQLRDSRAREPMLGASLLLAVPFMWPIAGLAITELPALAAFALFLLLFQRSLDAPVEKFQVRAILAITSGIALGAAVLGRQNYLVILPCVALLAFVHRQHWLPILFAISACVVTSGWLFLLWKEMVPPAAVGGDPGLVWEHAILGASYLGAATLFIAPEKLRPESRGELVLGLLAAGLLFAWMLPGDFLPVPSVLGRVLPAGTARWIGLGAGAAMTWLGVQWLLGVGRTAWRCRKDPWDFFLAITLLAIALAPAKITHDFSSRYVVGGVGVSCLLFARQQELRLPSILRLLIGTCLGAASLNAYYLWAFER